MLLLGMAALVPLALYAWRSGYRSALHACGGGLALLAGALSLDLRRPGPPPEIDFTPGEELLLSGCIVEPVQSDAVRSRFVLQLEPGANVRVTLTAREGEALPALAYGDQVELEGRLRKPRNFGNPGAFDYVGYLRRHEVYWTASARGVEKIRKLRGQCGTSVGLAAGRIRQHITDQVRKHFAPEWNEARLLPALLIGSTSLSDRTANEDFRRTGTYHALVVSGLHIAVVAGGLLALLRALGVPLGIMLPAAALTAWLYAAVVNWQPPAVRSAAGFTLFLVARWFFRRGRVLNILAAVTLVILAVDPRAVFDPSFQLTVLSVAAIGALAAPAAERWIKPYAAGLRRLVDPEADAQSPPHIAELRIEFRLIAETLALLTRGPQRLFVKGFGWAGRLALIVADAALLTVCVQAALSVPMIVYFHRFSVTSVPANVTVSPALSAAVPTAFVATLTGFPPLVHASRGLLWFADVMTTFWAAQEPGWRTPDPSWSTAAGSLIGMAVLALCLSFRVRARWLFPAVAVATASLVLLWHGPCHPRHRAGEFEMTAIDVGQGDSVLLVSPEGRTMLVDAGGIPSFDPRIRPGLEIGEDVVSPYLWRRGVRRLDVVAITHLHADHSAGVPAVLRNFRPSELWTGAFPAGPAADEILRAARESGTRIRQLRAPQRLGFGTAGIRVMAPEPDYQPGREPHNADSLVLRVEYRDRSFLLTGDADERVEMGMLARSDLPAADVLKVGHHGSRTSTTPSFLASVQPLFAAISAGVDNTYKHPHPALLGRLSDSGCRVWRTDERGLVSFFTDGHRIEVFDFSTGWEQP